MQDLDIRVRPTDRHMVEMVIEATNREAGEKTGSTSEFSGSLARELARRLILAADALDRQGRSG